MSKKLISYGCCTPKVNWCGHLKTRMSKKHNVDRTEKAQGLGEGGAGRDTYSG